MSNQLKTTYPLYQSEISIVDFSQAIVWAPARLSRIILYKAFNSVENSTLNVLRNFLSLGISQKQPLTENHPFFTVKRSRTGYPIRYTSAIALRLAASFPQSAAEIAEMLVTHMLTTGADRGSTNSHSELPVEVLARPSVCATVAGYIEFGFSDAAIAQYFDPLIYFLPPSSEQDCFPLSLLKPSQFNPRIFRLQHAHARCCSLLRLAHENQFLQLSAQSPWQQIQDWQIILPSSLIWLTDTLNFLTNHPSELQLIAQIVTVLDALADHCLTSRQESTSPEHPLPGKPQAIRTLFAVAEGLSRAFHNTYKHWPLMGNSRTQPRDRLQAHLGLILITQRLLYHLLHNQLDVESPFEL